MPTCAQISPALNGRSSRGRQRHGTVCQFSCGTLKLDPPGSTFFISTDYLADARSLAFRGHTAAEVPRLEPRAARGGTPLEISRRGAIPPSAKGRRDGI